MDTATAPCMDTPQVSGLIDSCGVHGHGRRVRAVRRNERDKGVHTPTHSIRMSAELWDELEEVYGKRSRSRIFEEYAMWLLRKPGGKLADRKPR